MFQVVDYWSITEKIVLRWYNTGRIVTTALHSVAGIDDFINFMNIMQKLQMKKQASDE